MSSTIGKVSALNNSENSEAYPHINRYLLSFFQGDKTIKIHNNDGEDVSNQFFEQNCVLYENDDYQSIVDNFINEVNTTCYARGKILALAL